MNKKFLKQIRDVLISYFIFIAMLVTIFISMGYLNKTCLSLEGQSNNIEGYINAGSWDKAYSSSMDFFDKWQKRSKIISAFVNHQEIDNINLELWKLTQYVKCKNQEESLASIHSLKFMLDHITNLEKITISNIF